MTDAFTASDERWMSEALKFADAAMAQKELPIAAILVGGEKELSRSTTLNSTKESLVAHAELFALLQAKRTVFTADRPLRIYTNLEPCLMCIGAALNATVDEIVFGADAPPDGGVRFLAGLEGKGQKLPKARGGLMRSETHRLMREFIKRFPNHPATPYARQLL